MRTVTNRERMSEGRLQEWTYPTDLEIALLSPVHADVDSDKEAPQVRWRELLGLILIVALCDLTIYRGKGFAGYTALFAGVPTLLLAGTARLRPNASLWASAPMDQVHRPRGAPHGAQRVP
ncbi:MAG: hypothetical protein HY000_40190 [Planctomycetes bacterium]|nr:hypothetical protein [Planctomycetota bacterium]